MRRICVWAMILAMALAAPLWAQSWTSSTIDTGGLMHAVAKVNGGSVRFSCNALSPARRPLIETEDHETIRTAPLSMILSISADLVKPVGGPAQLNPLRLSVDGQDYALPPAHWDELYWEWMVHISLDSAFWPALTRAQTLIVDPGRGVAYDYPVDGLGAALSTSIRYCLQGWQGAGTAIPLSLQPWMQAAVPRAPSPNPGPQPQANVAGHIARLCAASYSFDPANLLSGDLDGDGIADHVLDWGKVSCHGNMGARPFCGAANCQIDVFLSSRGFVIEEGQGFLGVGVRLVPLNTGRAGLMIGGTARTCATGACARPWYWTGRGFSQ